MSPNNRAGTLSVATLRSLLTPRDLDILHHIREHTFLTTKHIQRLRFWDHASPGAAIRACIRVLSRLESHALIYRTQRQIGGIYGGSSSYVWGIDDAGDRLLRAESGDPDAKRKRSFEPTQLFLAHTIAIAETRVRLEEATHDMQLELISITTEPANWRPFISRAGHRQTLKPDLHAVTAVPSSEFEDLWFYEIDNGSESIATTVIAKCMRYQMHFETGQEQATSGAYPVVVWLIGDPNRRQRLSAAIHADTRLNDQLFRVIAPDELLPTTTGTDPSGAPEVKTIPHHQTSGLLWPSELSSEGQKASELGKMPLNSTFNERRTYEMQE